MKASTIGIVSAAILMVVASVGFGIAQAGGNHTDGPGLFCVDQEALDQSDSSSPHALVLPSGIDLEYDAGGNPTQGMAQAREALEAGSLPDMSNTDSSNVGTEEHNYLGGVDIDSPKVENAGYTERVWKGDIDGH